VILRHAVCSLFRSRLAFERLLEVCRIVCRLAIRTFFFLNFFSFFFLFPQPCFNAGVFLGLFGVVVSSFFFCGCGALPLLGGLGVGSLGGGGFGFCFVCGCVFVCVFWGVVVFFFWCGLGGFFLLGGVFFGVFFFVVGVFFFFFCFFCWGLVSWFFGLLGVLLGFVFCVVFGVRFGPADIASLAALSPRPGVPVTSVLCLSSFWIFFFLQRTWG